MPLSLKTNCARRCRTTSPRTKKITFGLLRIVELLLVVLFLTIAQRGYSAEPESDFVRTECDTISQYAATLEQDLIDLTFDFDTFAAISVADADSLRLSLKVMGWEVDYLRGNQRRWYHDSRLWFLAGAVSATFVMGTALQITF